MSGGLYQKPGHASTEFSLVKAYGVAAASCAAAGGIACSFSWPGWLAGLFLVAASPVVALVPTVAYILSRGKVKAAAEQNQPPKSRVC